MEHRHHYGKFFMMFPRFTIRCGRHRTTIDVLRLCPDTGRNYATVLQSEAKLYRELFTRYAKLYRGIVHVPISVRHHEGWDVFTYL